MKRQIFYSWQSDTDENHNRYLIRDALIAAAKRLSVPCEVDEATRGVSGSPPIFETILQKIDQSMAFVGDLTLVTGIAKPPSSNPNVLIEYGYALARLQERRLISVLNQSYGSPEQLPFDLRHRAVRVVYDLGPSADRSAIKEAKGHLEGRFISELRQVLEGNIDGPPEAFSAKWDSLSDSTRQVVHALLSQGGSASEAATRRTLMEGAGIDVNTATTAFQEAKIQLVQAGLGTVTPDTYSGAGDTISISDTWRYYLQKEVAAAKRDGLGCSRENV
jgi:hypothetical protein